ncbi:hypothetical protein BCR44DRAFT_1418978 [Catenaria anguillulae PL171]|uniref:Kinesin motor domain-containing protein n=1 Tax=Catenaria anguillulae PL171 TaxID=765915 RepID=A0A1Y2H6X1_9FUNG|nr:hypothetical protein BCR44DRAFT_1418978 [Catenaria anguillulae PL171]
MATTSVKVALRVRPLTAKETLANEYECLSPIPGVPQVVLGKDRSFTYDHVFWTDTHQSQLYEDAVAPLLEKFLEGFNATVLAYGQTGSGKTYSMGTGLDGNIGTENQGIVPRAISVMFDELPRRYPEPSSYSVAVSFLELYNEELIDLLNPSNRPDTAAASAAASRPGSVRGGFGSGPSSVASGGDTLRIREDEYGNIVWVGVREEPCASPEQLLGFLNKGSLCRTTGSTDMNMVSSRSHAIFSVTLRLNKVDPESGVTERIMAKFHFVDLAGSERLKKTHAEGTRAKEGIAINSGLLALGNVISALGDESRLASGGGGHVPYRDSKLTRLLQDSLGGNSQTLMLACVSPADTNFQETLSTLKYANRARNIKNKVQINPQQGANSVEVQQLRTQISRLKLELATLKEQYGLSSGAPSGTGAGGLVSASSSAENLAKLHEQNSVFGSNLRSQVKDLQNERAKLEVHILQLQNRIKTIEHQLVLVQAERDALLMEKNGWTLPDRPDEDAMDTDDSLPSSSSSPNAAQPPNPLLVSYLTKISELQHALSDRETELVMVKQQAAAISAAAPSANGPSSSSSLSTSGRKQFRFVLPGSAGAGGVMDDDVNATLLRAREQIRQDMKFLLDTSSNKGDANGNGGPPSLAQAGEGGTLGMQGALGNYAGSEGAESAISEVERPMVLGGALDVPTWAKTPTVVNGGDEGGSSVSQSGGGGGGGGGGATVMTQAPELLHRALHKIQADLAVKEELMTRLESTHREYLNMKDAYEDKLSQLQQSLSSVRSERDEALVRMQATNGPREKERDIRARYESKVKQLLGEISNLRKNHIEATKAMTSSKKSEMMLRQLKLSVDALRAEKTRLLKKMREDAEKSREQAQAAEREIQKLRRKERMATETAKKYERNFELQKVLLKRRAEEIVASNQKLKSVTALLKRSSVQKTIMKPGSAPAGFAAAAGGMHRGSITSLVGDSIVRPDSAAPDSSRANTPHIDREQQELALTYRKHQLYKEMETVVTTQQQSAELEQLVSKRKRLTDEKIELLNERDRVVIAEAERLGKEPDPAAPQYMDDRLESIDAELQYVDMRIKAVQAEAASSDAQSSSANGGVSGYEAVVGLVRSLGAEDAVQLLESIVDDFIQLQISARNQAMEVTRQETQIDSLRKNLLLMRKTAMKNAVDYEKRIKTMAVDGYLQQQQQHQNSGANQSQQQPSSVVSPYDSIMGISVFPDLRPPSSTSPIPISSRASSPAYSYTARRAGANDDDSMSVTSSTSGSPLKSGAISSAQSDAGSAGGPREHRSMSMSSGTSGPATASSVYSTSTAPRRPRPQSATSDVFERLAKTYTVAAQAKIRDPGQFPDNGGAPGNATSTGPSLTRRESHDKLQQVYTSGSNLNLALGQIDEEHGHSSGGTPWPVAPGSRTSGGGRRPASTMSVSGSSACRTRQQRMMHNQRRNHHRNSNRM